MELGRVFREKSVYRLWQGKEVPIVIIECMKSDVPVITSNRHFNSEVCLEYAKLFESGAVTDVVYKIVED